MTTPAHLDGDDFPGFRSIRRGLAYGDGLFETMRARNGEVALWSGHMTRLQWGCERLGLDAPDASQLQEERDRWLVRYPDAVLKLMLWRRDRGPGYDPSGERGTHLCWTASALPTQDPAPLRVRWCDLRFARQPKLAGIKHLNRLESVLARAEWKAGAWDEGLVCDSAGEVISAVAGNFFAVLDGRLATPSLEQCGVAGVLRAWLLERATLSEPVEVRAILPAELDRASEMFVTNAVRGIRTVGRLADREYAHGPVTATWMARARSARLMDDEDFAG